MPAFLILVNQAQRALPQIWSVVCSQPTRERAIAWTLDDEFIFVRDLEVLLLSERDDHWFAGWGTA